MTSTTFTVYADPADPLAHLLSQRLDAVAALTGARVRWCAVQHERTWSIQGRRVSEQEEHGLLAQVRRLARPEEVVAEHFSFRPHSAAMVSALAEAVSDGRSDELRRALVHAVHVVGRDLGSADEVRRVVAEVMCPQLADCGTALAEGWAPMGVPDPATTMRALGGTTTRLGSPITSAGQARVERWRREWAAHGAPEQPLLVTPLGELLVGEQALAHLARCLTVPAAPVVPAARDAAAHVAVSVPA